MEMILNMDRPNDSVDDYNICKYNINCYYIYVLLNWLHFSLVIVFVQLN